MSRLARTLPPNVERAVALVMQRVDSGAAAALQLHDARRKSAEARERIERLG